MDINLILSQAFEESRYHRQFHHTIYTLWVTFYLALLGFQISALANIPAIKSNAMQMISFVLFLFVVIPIYVSYLIFDYHKTITQINSIIANVALLQKETIKSELSEPGYQLLNSALDKLLFAKYASVVSKGQNPLFVGRGHWFFFISFLLVVLCNVFIFLAV